MKTSTFPTETVLQSGNLERTASSTVPRRGDGAKTTSFTRWGLRVAGLGGVLGLGLVASAFYLARYRNGE